MYATVGSDVPRGPDWTFEPKYDGMRVLAFVTARGVRLVTRNGKDKAGQFPEVLVSLQALERRVGKPLVLDGEIVALDRTGRPGPFQRLQGRFHLAHAGTVAVRAAERPAAFIAFDLLAIDDEELIDRPWSERRARLERVLDRALPAVRLGESSRSGPATLRAAQRHGWEGVIAKRTDATYSPGVRSRDWLKLKLQHRAEFVVGGFTEPRGTRPYLGAILLGYFDEQGRLRYAGHTGGGFDREALRSMRSRLGRLERATSPFAEPPRTNERVHWVRPTVVVEVKFAEWTRDGRLRQPIFLGVRDDKPAREVLREAESLQEWRHRSATNRVARRRPVAAATERRPRPSRRMARSSAPETAPGAGATRARDVVEQIESVIAAGGDGVLALGRGRRLRVSSLAKVYFPESGITKGDLMRYYAQLSPVLLPLIAARPLILKRYPDGIEGPSFFQQSAGPNAPRGIRTAELDTQDGSRARRIIGGDLFTLLYTVQIGTIAVHPWASRLTTIDQADYCTVDLDPGEGVPFSAVVELARLVKAELDTSGLAAAVKTSGSRGLHIAIPLPRRTPYADSAALADRTARRVAEANPGLATMERRLDRRPKRTIYLDAQQNARGKSTASAYAVRAREPGTVSTPLRWTELRDSLRLEAFTIRTVPARVARLGDIWGESLARRNSAHALAHALRR